MSYRKILAASVGVAPTLMFELLAFYRLEGRSLEDTLPKLSTFSSTRR